MERHDTNKINRSQSRTRFRRSGSDVIIALGLALLPWVLAPSAAAQDDAVDLDMQSVIEAMHGIHRDVARERSGRLTNTWGAPVPVSQWITHGPTFVVPESVTITSTVDAANTFIVSVDRTGSPATSSAFQVSLELPRADAVPPVVADKKPPANHTTLAAPEEDMAESQGDISTHTEPAADQEAIAQDENHAEPVKADAFAIPVPAVSRTN